MPRRGGFTHVVKKGYTIFACVFDGEGCFDEDGDEVVIAADKVPLRFLGLAGVGGRRRAIINRGPH